MGAYNIVSAGSMAAGQPEDISPILANFQAIAFVLNGHIDNSNIDPAAAIDASKIAGLSTIPTGVILPFGAAAAPTGFVLADGSAISRIGANAALFALIGVTYGVGDGATTFNVPDMVGRVPVGLSAAGPALINALAKNDGVAKNLRNVSHHHTYIGPPNVAVSATGNSISAGTDNTSGDANNTDNPAFLVVNYIIKL